MSDWQIGDDALCVTKRVLRCPECDCLQDGGDAPAVGAMSKVVRIGRCDDDDTPEEREVFEPCSFPVLHLVSGHAGMVLRFSKIRPHQSDEQDEITIELLNGVPVEA